jgi:phospho-2-dehydro-3-deoxyheptonate aldolase
MCWQGRADCNAVIDGSDDRLIVVVGPCSIHDPKAAVRAAADAVCALACVGTVS